MTKAIKSKLSFSQLESLFWNHEFLDHSFIANFTSNGLKSNTWKTERRFRIIQRRRKIWLQAKNMCDRPREVKMCQLTQLHRQFDMQMSISLRFDELSQTQQTSTSRNPNIWINHSHILTFDPTFEPNSWVILNHFRPLIVCFTFF